MTLPLTLLVMILTALLFTAFGMSIGSVLEDMQGFQLIVNFLIMPMFFLSGSLFPLSGLPSVVKVIALADPLTYGVDGLRYAILGANMANFGIGTDLFVLTAVTAVFLALGSYLFSKIQI